MKEFLSFEGRARGTYVLGAYFLLVIVAEVAGAFAELAHEAARMPVETLIMLLIVPTFVRCMHDNGRSGWWAIVLTIAFVPRVDGSIDPNPFDWSQAWPILLRAPFMFWGAWLLIQPGEGDPSRYGPDPRLREGAIDR